MTIIQRFRINSHTHTRMQDIWERMETLSKQDMQDDWSLIDFDFPIIQSPQLEAEEKKKNGENMGIGPGLLGLSKKNGGLFSNLKLFNPSA